MIRAEGPAGPAWAPAPARFAVRLPADLGVLLVAALALGVSGGLLWTVGINYDGLTGSAVQKIHPATYLAVVLFAFAMVRRGNPVANAVAVAERRPACLLLGIVAVGFSLQIALRGGAGIAGALDTFLLPALFCILLMDSSTDTFRRMEAIVHALMAANALIGIVELGIGQRFFPYRLDGAVFETDTRSAGLQGHPLVNATMTATYIMALMTGGGSLAPLTRLAMIGLQLAALVTFGGRSAIVLTLVIGGAYGLVGLMRSLKSGRIPLLAVAGVLFAVPVAALALAVLANGGFFDALLSRFDNDGGSANARVAMLDIVAALPLRDLIVAPDPALVDSLRRIGGLEMGLENPIMRVLLYQGALMTGLLTLAVTLFLFEVSRRCRPGIALPMITWLILINTFESIGSKMTLLTKFVVLLLALYRPLDEAVRRR